MDSDLENLKRQVLEKIKISVDKDKWKMIRNYVHFRTYSIHRASFTHEGFEKGVLSTYRTYKYTAYAGNIVVATGTEIETLWNKVQTAMIKDKYDADIKTLKAILNAD